MQTSEASNVVSLNPSGIRPTEFKVLVKPKAVEEKIGSIFIPEPAREREQHAQMEGEIVAVSPVAFTYADWPEGVTLPRIGDRVLFAKYAGAIVKGRDGAEYRIINDKDVAAVLE